MSILDVRKLFVYRMFTSSVSYIRNYNFNSSVVSTLPLSMSNSSEEISLTVNITTNVPWIGVVDPNTGNNRKYPNGNVVLGPTSSSLVYIKLDLPPELETDTPKDEPISSLITLDIKSGSFPIIGQDNETGNKPTNVIVVENDIYNINVGEIVPVNFTIYGSNGTVEPIAVVTLRSDNMSIVQEVPQEENGETISYSPRYIKGISPGTTTVTITANDNITTSIRVTTRTAPPTDDSSDNNDNSENDRTRSGEL